MENLIRNDYFDDLKMLSSQIVNSKSNYYEITDNFERVNKDFLIEVRSKGQYGDIELKNILIKFDSLGFTRGIYLNNDSITRE